MEESKSKILLALFLSTFKIGAFTFGGGYAMMPLLEEEFVDKKGWLSDHEIVDIFAVVQSAPGALAINSSIYLGYKVAGILGAIVSVLGIVLPSFIIISLISGVYLELKNSEIAYAALQGIRSGVVALIILTVMKLGKRSVKEKLDYALATIAFIAAIFFNVNPVYIIIGSALFGLIFLTKKFRTEADK